MSDFKDDNDTAKAALLTSNRQVVTLDSYWRWVAQGKVFEAGNSLQTAPDNSQGETALTPDDVKASFALVAPASKSPIIVPLLFKVMFETDGAAAPDSWLIFTRSAPIMGVSLVISGLAATAQNCTYASNPIKGSPKASAIKGVASTWLVTVSALDTANDCVLYHMALMADAGVTTAGMGVTGNGFFQQHSFLKDTGGFPRFLTSGAAMIYYISAAGGDATVHPYIQWAELEPEDLL